jgi:hypothetical protein
LPLPFRGFFRQTLLLGGFLGPAGLLGLPGFFRLPCLFGLPLPFGGFFRQTLLLRSLRGLFGLAGIFCRRRFGSNAGGFFGGQTFLLGKFGGVPLGEIPPALNAGAAGQGKDNHGAQNNRYTKNIFFHCFPL